MVRLAKLVLGSAAAVVTGLAAPSGPMVGDELSPPSSPAMLRDGDRGFSLSVTEKPDGQRDFVRDWVAVHQKWGSGVSEEVMSTFALSDAEGRIDVDPIGKDDIYIAEIEVGDPPQLLKIALDTGSSDFWVQSTDTIYNANLHGPWAPKYYPNTSHTAELVEDAEWGLQYMDGTRASGIVYLDTVRLGNLVVPNVSIQSAQHIAPRFERETSLTGIMGLAKKLPSNVIPLAPTFLDIMRPLLDRPVFTADLRRGAPGRFDFGYIDETLFIVDDDGEGGDEGGGGSSSAELTWLDSSPDSPHWDVHFDLTAWDAGPNTTWWLHDFAATVDTGTTLMFLPDVLASMYWFAVPGMRVDPRLSNAFTFPCDLAASGLPDLRLKLPGSEHVLTVPGPYLNYGPVEADPGYCWGGMQSADGLDAVILGDIMLKAVFVAFDLENNKVGFANKPLHDIT